MLGNVPLFSGFMYAAVGSYIARSWRTMNLSFSHYPSRMLTVLLAVAIYQFLYASLHCGFQITSVCCGSNALWPRLGQLYI